MTRGILFLFALSIIAMHSLVFAESMTVTYTAHQPIEGGLLPEDGMVLAGAKAKQEVLQKVAESWNANRLSPESKNVFFAILKGVLKLEVLSQKENLNFRGHITGITVVARSQYDSEELRKKSRTLMDHSSHLKRYEENLRREKELLEKAAELEEWNREGRGLWFWERRPLKKLLQGQFGMLSNQLRTVALVEKALHLWPLNDEPDSRQLLWQAWRLLDQAARIDPDYFAIYQLRGDIRVANIDPELAIIEYDQAIRLNPICASLYSSRAIAWALLYEYDRACKDAKRASELGDDTVLRMFEVFEMMQSTK